MIHKVPVHIQPTVPIHRALCSRVVFHAYLVYLFTHIWCTSAGFSRISGVLLRIFGVRISAIVLILLMMRASLYTYMECLYESPVAAARAVEIATTGRPTQALRPLAGERRLRAQRVSLGMCGAEGRSNTPPSSISSRRAE